jgi:hypothetical protein
VKADLDVADASAPRPRCHFHEPQYASTEVGIRLMMPIEKMRIRPNGAIAVLRAMMVGEQAFCFSVDTATF